MSNDRPREILLALVNAVEGREDEFEEWYSTVHIPEILELPGFVSAQRYVISEEAAAGFRYATVYEVEGSAAEARTRLFGAGLGASPALDQSQLVLTPFTALGEPLRASD